MPFKDNESISLSIMNGKHYFLVWIFLLIFSFTHAQNTKQGYSIDVEILGASGNEVLLAHRYGDKFFTDDTIHMDDDGRGRFSGTTALQHGMYQVVLPDKTFFDFFIEDHQHFGLKTVVGKFVQSNQAVDEHFNQVFFNWHRASSKYRNTPEMQTVWDTTLQSLGTSLAGKFLASLMPFKIPEELKTNEGFQNNQLAQYHYYKDHFFDNTDLSDPKLLRTPVIHNKLNQFFSKVAPPQPDSLAFYCDLVLEKTSLSKEVFRYTLQFLINYYSDPKIMGTDAVYVHLAEKYYLSGKAEWIDELNLNQIANRVKELKPLLIGRQAPPLKGLQTPDGQPVSPFDYSGKWTILYFWEPDCGHCKTATPALFKDYEFFKSVDAEVFAINTRLDMDSWNAFIAEHELVWVNLYAPLNIRELLENYQAWSTPILYILDSDKKIVAKDLSVEQVKDYLTYLDKQKI